MWAIIWACVQMYLSVCGSWCFFFHWEEMSASSESYNKLQVISFHNTLNSFISTDQGRFDSSWYEPFRKQNLPASYSLLLSCNMTGRIRALLTICQCRPQMSQAVSAFDWQLLCCGVCVTAVCPDTHLWSENLKNPHWCAELKLLHKINDEGQHCFT